MTLDRTPLPVSRSRDLHNDSLQIFRSIRIRLSEREALICTIEETATSIEDLRYWMRLKGRGTA